MNTLLLIGGLRGPEILLIALVVLLFFGGRKIPELMKGLGKGVRSFKEGMNEVEDSLKEEKGKGDGERAAKAESPKPSETTKESEQNG